MAAKKVEAKKAVKKQELKYTLAIPMLGFKKGQAVTPDQFTEHSFKYWLEKGAIIKK